MIRDPEKEGGRFLAFYMLSVAIVLLTSIALLSGMTASESYCGPIGVFCGTASIVVIATMHRLGFAWLSGPIVYAGYLWLFHFPLLFIGSLDSARLDHLPFQIQLWTHGESWYIAGLLALLCLTAFALGSGLSLGMTSRLHVSLKAGRWQDEPLQKLGLLELVVGVGMIVVAIVKSGGYAIFTEAYRALYDDLFGKGLYAIGINLATQGLLFSAIGVKQRGLKTVFLCQGAFTCILLAFGARSNALIPALLFFVIMEKRKIKLPRWIMVGAPLILLWVIAIVGAARNEAVLGNARETAFVVTPMDGLLELGASLHTVALGVEWIKGGDKIQLGGGYWLPFERMIGLLVPEVRRPLETDPRAMSEVLLSRERGLGGSTVAESYYNFGMIGALIFFLPLGYLIGRLNNADTPIATAWFIVFLYPFLIDVRNWFLSVPAMVLTGIVPMAALYLYRSTLRERGLAPARFFAQGGRRTQ